MAQFFTSNTLIQSIKRRAMVPDNQSTFTDEDFLAFANEEISMGMVPMILRHHEDFFLVNEEVPLVAGKAEYQIPARAIGNKLREISFKDNNGNIYEMTRIEIQDLPHYNDTFRGGVAYAFYVKNNKIVLPGGSTIPANGNLVFSYFMRPNEMVVESRAAQIKSINTSTGEIEVYSLPVDSSNAQLFSTSTKLDFIGKNSPHITLNYDITPTNINTGTNIITFNVDDLPSDLEVGDYVNLACECIVPQIPSDLHMQLAQRVAVRCLEAMGDMQGVQVATAKLAELDVNASSVIDNRVEGSPRKVVNRHGILRSGMYRRRFRFRS